MRTLFAVMLFALVGVSGVSPAVSDEAGFSTYGLGGSAFDAGVTPPAGTYITFGSGFYSGKIGGAVTLGDVTLNAGARVDFFQAFINGLYVSDQKVLGGNFGLSVTIPTGHIRMNAEVSAPPLPAVERETSGWGLGDITTKAQLGWQVGNFAHTAYVQVVAPSGRYAVGFQPDIGLNRPGIDTGWSFTWTEKASKFQVNGKLGVTFNFENTLTNYQSGTDFHFEWAVGQEVCPGLVVGVGGYDFRQLTADSGSGAILGPFKGTVDAIGPAFSYTTLIDKTPVILSGHFYQEFNAKKRWEGNSSMLSATVRF